MSRQAITVQMNNMPLGDPPMGVFPGTTWIPTRTSDNTGGRDTWVGDFPPNFDPMNPYGPTIIPLGPAPYPGVGDILPFQHHNHFIQVVGNTPVPAWRVTHTHNSVVAAVDMPGVKKIDVVIENGSIIVSAQRYDTNMPVSATQFIGADYDPKTAEASLECGVLTVTVKKFTEKMTHKVAVAVR